MLLYTYLGEFNVILDLFDLIEIGLWIVCCILMLIATILFKKDSKKLNKKFIYISLFFGLFIIARIFRLMAKFWVGEDPSVPASQFSPVLLPFQISYNMFTYLGLFFLYFVLESSILKKTHYIFCVIVIITIGLSFIQYMIDIFLIILPFYAICLLGLPIIFINLARKVVGRLRTNALLVALGCLLFELGVIFDIPEATQLWQNSIEFSTVVKFLAPIFQIFGIILVRKGFPREI